MNRFADKFKKFSTTAIGLYVLDELCKLQSQRPSCYRLIKKQEEHSISSIATRPTKLHKMRISTIKNRLATTLANKIGTEFQSFNIDFYYRRSIICRVLLLI